jgi:hypothetical protein
MAGGEGGSGKFGKGIEREEGKGKLHDNEWKVNGGGWWDKWVRWVGRYRKCDGEIKKQIRRDVGDVR